MMDRGVDAQDLETEADYDHALREIEEYFNDEPEAGTAAADRFNELATLIARYEERHWPIQEKAD